MLFAMLSVPTPARAQQCIDGACVVAGPRLANVSTTQSALLNPLLQALLPGTSIDLSVADWNALATADIDLNLLLIQLGADVGVSDPSQVLDTDVRLGQLMVAAATVLEADGQTAAANVLNLLGANVGGLFGTIRLGELLVLDFPQGALADVKLGVLDLLTGWVQLYNFSNVITTPQPITIDTGALALPGITAIELWAQVVEPPVYACGPTGTQFYSAAVRVKLNVTAANTAVLDPSTGQDIDEATFAKQLAHGLNQGALKQQYEHLVLIADPATLGRVRPQLHKEVQARLVSEIAKTLTNAPLGDIEPALRGSAA